MTYASSTYYFGSNTAITRLSPAKINLFLHITQKRADGYHDLQTVFRLLDWGDYLHFLPSDSLAVAPLIQSIPDFWAKSSSDQAAALCDGLIKLNGAAAITENLADNLIIKAAVALLQHALEQDELPEVLSQITLSIDKHIPMGAGLGGGSSNAATTLTTLNHLWQLDLTLDSLYELGVKLGADVPVFIFNQDAIGSGIGDALAPILLPEQYYLLLTPSAHISTETLFAHPKLCRTMPVLATTDIETQAADFYQTLKPPYQNVFTPIVTDMAPKVAEALDYLQSLLPAEVSAARMSGTGSAVFLPLPDEIAFDEDTIQSWIDRAPCPAILVHNL